MGGEEECFKGKELWATVVAAALVIGSWSMNDLFEKFHDHFRPSGIR